MEIKTIELYNSPLRDKNEEKYGTTSGNQCICCMKPMKDGETKMVHMTTDWVAINVDTDKNGVINEEHQSQGFFPIGNSCAKKMPKEFIFNL